MPKSGSLCVCADSPGRHTEEEEKEQEEQEEQEEESTAPSLRPRVTGEFLKQKGIMFHEENQSPQ